MKHSLTKLCFLCYRRCGKIVGLLRLLDCWIAEIKINTIIKHGDTINTIATERELTIMAIIDERSPQSLQLAT